MNSKFLCFASFCISILCFSNIYAESNSEPFICNQVYALCTSAPCIPSPHNPDYAICDCDVHKGNSAGFTDCKSRKPNQDNYGALHIVSTFSFEQFSTKKQMQCSQLSPWTDCLDKPCTVDPQNPNRAICNCKIKLAQAFITFGGNCNTQTCITGFWSGATKKTGAVLENALRKVVKDTQKTHAVYCRTPDKE